VHPDSQHRLSLVCERSADAVNVYVIAACSRRPPDVRYGLVRFHSMRHGDRARYKCNPGFELIGDTYLTCLYGRWTGKVPTCEEGMLR